MRKPKGRCTYCGAEGVPLERGHVAPKNLYPDSRRTPDLQLITVPECRACNHGWSDDEAYFRGVLLLAGEPNEPVRELWSTSIRRSLNEKDGLRRASDLVERFVPVTVDGEHRKMIYPGEDPRVIRIIKKIVRGLSHHHGIEDGVDDERIRADVLRFSVPDELWSTGTFCKRGSDIFRYWYKRYGKDDKELSSLWILTFFDRRDFVAIVDLPNRSWPAFEEDKPAGGTN
jgi:hypothetical protein